VSDERRRRTRDLWQLHLPLVLVLALCAFATAVEFSRAREGVDRAWAYTIQWPVIGLFAIVVWNRYRKHGSITKSISGYFRARVARFEAEALEQEAREQEAREQEALATAAANDSGEGAPSIDPDEQAWRDHVRELQRRDPPGGPPQRAQQDPEQG